jgi:hypothetical protein
MMHLSMPLLFFVGLLTGLPTRTDEYADVCFVDPGPGGRTTSDLVHKAGRYAFVIDADE